MNLQLQALADGTVTVRGNLEVEDVNPGLQAGYAPGSQIFFDSVDREQTKLVFNGTVRDNGGNFASVAVRIENRSGDRQPSAVSKNPEPEDGDLGLSRGADNDAPSSSSQNDDGDLGLEYDDLPRRKSENSIVALFPGSSREHVTSLPLTIQYQYSGDLGPDVFVTAKAFSSSGEEASHATLIKSEPVRGPFPWC